MARTAKSKRDASPLEVIAVDDSNYLYVGDGSVIEGMWRITFRVKSEKGAYWIYTMYAPGVPVYPFAQHADDESLLTIMHAIPALHSRLLCLARRGGPPSGDAKKVYEAEKARLARRAPR